MSQKRRFGDLLGDFGQGSGLLCGAVWSLRVLWGLGCLNHCPQLTWCRLCGCWWNTWCASCLKHATWTNHLDVQISSWLHYFFCILWHFMMLLLLWFLFCMSSLWQLTFLVPAWPCTDENVSNTKSSGCEWETLPASMINVLYNDFIVKASWCVNIWDMRCAWLDIMAKQINRRLPYGVVIVHVVRVNHQSEPSQWWTIRQSKCKVYLPSMLMLSSLYSTPITLLPPTQKRKHCLVAFTLCQAFSPYLDYIQLTRLEAHPCLLFVSFLPGLSARANLFVNTWSQSITMQVRFHVGYQAMRERCVTGEMH